MPSLRSSLAWLPLTALLAVGCSESPPDVGAQLFQSPQVNAIALDELKNMLLVANTTSGTLSMYRAGMLPGDPAAALWAEVRVGIDPVGIAIRPRLSNDEPALVLVTNHISDSISVVEIGRKMVVQTLQAFDEDGVTTTDAPSGVVFAGPDRAFVALDDRNEILVIDFDAEGVASINPERLFIPAQAPRAMTVVGDRLLVGSFESGNQTEFPNCGPLDTVDTAPFLPGDSHDEGCMFYNRFLEDFEFEIVDNNVNFDLEFGVIVAFAAQNPNIGGEVIIDRDRPDRDIIVFDTNTLGPPVQVIDGLTTLIYGLESSGNRVWATSTQGRNDLDGLEDLDNRMFENRLSYMDCSPACGPAAHQDLDQNGFNVPVPTPYGIRASANGQQLVVSVSGSDGRPGLAEDPTTDIPGLVTLDADGNVLGHVPTGAIPQSVALASDAAGNAATAYVLNTIDSTVSIVDVSDPANPTVLDTFEVGNDPVDDEIRLGRAMFMSARASTKGTFSCESCHPNGNTDQLIWTINNVQAPQDVPECKPLEENCPEPRTTQPIRGLRDTLPLHWMGNLADPFQNTGQLFQPEDSGAPDCDLEIDGENGCARHLVDAATSGVMCDQDGGCSIGPTGLPGALNDEERNAMARFMMSVSYPPSPTRLPDDSLSETALQGVADFFTDEDGLGVGSAAIGVGQVVGFAPITCADNSGGCHSLPLGDDTNSVTVGAFDAPGMRGIWDRHVTFSNGNPNSEEVMQASEDCAKGMPPGEHPTIPGLLTGDPCAISSPFIEGFLGINLDPFEGVPSGEDIYDPAIGVTERGAFLATFESLFALAYGVRGGPMWEFFNEMSVGFAGLYGRQLTFGPADALTAATADGLAEMIAAADAGKADLLATVGDVEYRYEVETGGWQLINASWKDDPAPFPAVSTAVLTQSVADSDPKFEQVMTVTVHLKRGVSVGGADRQPLLMVDPLSKATEQIGELLALPQPSPAGGDTFRLGTLYVDADAKVLVDGAVCDPCSFVAGSTVWGEHIDLTLAVPLSEGIHVLQVLNSDGWASNEMPMVVDADPVPIAEVPASTIACMDAAGCFADPDTSSECAEDAGCSDIPAKVDCPALDGCSFCSVHPDCNDGSCRPIPTIIAMEGECRVYPGGFL